MSIVKFVYVKVIAGARMEEVTQEETKDKDAIHLKIKTSQVPEKGKANERIIALLAAHLGIKVKEVLLTKGFTSRNKVFKISV